METTYLSGKIRDRITDLLKERNMTQSELALQIGSSDSTISRFMSKQTEKLSDENIVRIARVFNVSTDFLLGVTNIPDKKNYEISELGLSAQAARNLYTGKVNSDVVNVLLESNRFAALTYLLEQYFTNAMAVGFAAQNQLYTTLSSKLRGTVKTNAAMQAARDIDLLKRPVYQADLTNIEQQFMETVKEIKRDIGSFHADVQKATKAQVGQIFDTVTKGQDMSRPNITPEDISKAIVGSVASMNGVNQAGLSELETALTNFMKNPLVQSHEPPEQ